MSGARISLREILVATDFSTQSLRAFDAALALAELFGATLHVLHVVSNASEETAGRSHIESLGDKPAVIDIERTVVVGNPATEIVRYAGRQKMDLIVLGTHGRTGLARALMGSVAEAVVRSAPCQVLTIGPKAQVLDETPVAAKSSTLPERHCLVCAKESPETICDACKAHIQGEAIERKRREEQAGHRGLSI
jgi:nucleotide-binding universal stress UspA family protein